MKRSKGRLSDVLRIAGVYVKGIQQEFHEYPALVLASGLAFNSILCMIPILLLLTSLLGIFLNSSELAVIKIHEVLNAAFPPQPYALEIKTAIEEILTDIIQYRSSFGWYGSIILFWTAISLLNTMRTVLNTIFRVKTHNYIFHGIIKNLGLTIVLIILFVISNFSNWLLIVADSFIDRIPFLKEYDMDSMIQIALPVFAYLLALLMFFIIYRFVPAVRISSKVALTSAIAATFLWWLSQVIFGWYLSNYGSYNSLYGTYAFLIVFLLWVYYSSVVFVLGAMVGQVRREIIQKSGS